MSKNELSRSQGGELIPTPKLILDKSLEEPDVPYTVDID